MANAQRDDNYVPSLLAVSDVDGTTIVPLQADATTKRLKVAAVISGGGGTPGGSPGEVQFNDAGTFGGDAGLTYNKTTDVLTAGGVNVTSLTASSAVATDASKNLVSVTNTGTGNNVLATSPTLVTPALGTPSSGTLTSCTGLPISTGVSGLGTGVATFLATPSSANLRSALTDETGTGSAVFAQSPTLITPTLGAATATSINGVSIPTATSATLDLADSSTLATSGANSITLTSSGATNVTLPTTGTLATRAGTETLTNKTWVRRFVAVTQAAAPAMNTDNMDIASITGLAQAITSMTTNLTGTPVQGQMLMVQITDNGTPRAITWGASFAATTVALPTTTVTSTLLRVLFQRGASTWDCIAVA